MSIRDSKTVGECSSKDPGVNMNPTDIGYYSNCRQYAMNPSVALGSFKDSRSRPGWTVPEGHLTIARRFNAGWMTASGQVPKGRLNGGWAHDGILRREQATTAPSPPEVRRRRGLGRGGRPDASFSCFPLSLTLSPFVPHGERELLHCRSSDPDVETPGYSHDVPSGKSPRLRGPVSDICNLHGFQVPLTLLL